MARRSKTRRDPLKLELIEVPDDNHFRVDVRTSKEPLAKKGKRFSRYMAPSMGSASRCVFDAETCIYSSNHSS